MKQLTAKEFLLGAVSALQTQTLVIDIIAILLGGLEDFMYFQIISQDYLDLDGLFRTISCVLLLLGTSVLLISWANVVYSATTMKQSSTLPIKYLLALAAVYGYTVAFAVSGIVMINTVSTSQSNKGIFVLLIIGAILVLLLIIGFSIYGVYILWLFRLGRSKTELL
jgi:hypothetical protein